MLAEYQHKLNELVSICSDSCKGWWGTPWDIDELTEDLSAYKKKFNMVKEECMCFLPEGTPNMSSPPVAKSQPSTAEEEEVISSRTRTGSVPSMEETYNLANLFVSHQESQDIQKGAGIAPAFEVRDTEHGTEQVAQNKLFPENESINEATCSSYKKNDDQPEQNYLFNLAYLFNVADHSEVEAANEETDVREAAATDVTADSHKDTSFDLSCLFYESTEEDDIQCWAEETPGTTTEAPSREQEVLYNLSYLFETGTQDNQTKAEEPPGFMGEERVVAICCDPLATNIMLDTPVAPSMEKEITYDLAHPFNKGKQGSQLRVEGHPDVYNLSYLFETGTQDNQTKEEEHPGVMGEERVVAICCDPLATNIMLDTPEALSMEKELYDLSHLFNATGKQDSQLVEGHPDVMVKEKIVAICRDPIGNTNTPLAPETGSGTLAQAIPPPSPDHGTLDIINLPKLSIIALMIVILAQGIIGLVEPYPEGTEYMKRAAVEETPAGELLTLLAISLVTPSLDSDPSVRHVSNFKHVNQAVDTVGFQAEVPEIEIEKATKGTPVSPGEAEYNGKPCLSTVLILTIQFLTLSLLTPSLDPSVGHVNFEHVNQAIDTVGFQAEVPKTEESFCIGDTMVCNLSHLFNDNLIT